MEVFFDVDLAGIEPVPHTYQRWHATITPQAQVHISILKQKEPFFKNS